MECESCGENVDKNWTFCPKCGHSLEKETGDIFQDLFSKLGEEFVEMDKLFERDIEALDISPWFKKPKGRGFSIKIVSSGNNPPRVEVHGFGGVDESKLKKQVFHQIGVDSKEDIKANPPRKTEEPKANIRRENGRVVVELDLKDAKEKDVTINELESSVEVKAVVGDKAYFKILTKPEDTSITSSRFKNGILRLEFS